MKKNYCFISYLTWNKGMNSDQGMTRNNAFPNVPKKIIIHKE